MPSRAKIFHSVQDDRLEGTTARASPRPTPLLLLSVGGGASPTRFPPVLVGGDLPDAPPFPHRRGRPPGRPAVFHSSSTANAVPLLPQEKAFFVHYSLFIIHYSHFSFFQFAIYKLLYLCYNIKINPFALVCAYGKATKRNIKTEALYEMSHLRRNG